MVDEQFNMAKRISSLSRLKMQKVGTIMLISHAVLGVLDVLRLMRL